MRGGLTRFTVLAAVAAVGLLAGCGGGSSATKTTSQDPKTALSTGLQGLGDTDVLTVTLKLETTPSALVGFSKEDPTGTPLTDKQAQELAAGQFVVEFKTSDGTKLSALKPGSSSKTAVRFAFQDNGENLAEIRSLDNALFVQADLKSILGLFDKSKQYDDLTARTSTLPAFVKAFVAGKWVSLDLNALKSMASQFGVNTSTSTTQSQKLLADLKAAIDKDVTVTRLPADSNGDHLQLKTQSRQFVTDLVQAISADVPTAGLATGSLKPSSVPEHSIVVDAWVKDGALSKLSLDVVQFANPGEAKPGDHLPVVLTFDRSGDDISKPADVTPVDTSQLFSLLGALQTK
jgi:hypothetical protein